MYAEGLIAQAVDTEQKKKVITGLLGECYTEYGSMLSEIELRKGEGKSTARVATRRREA